jgi:8-hydroxy-5-deazaflavin:NADPH oxidoreductase
MNTTIFGAGNMGHGIGTRFVAGGHSVTLVDLNPETSEKTAGELRVAAKKGAEVSTASIGKVELGEIVVLAVAYGANIEIVRQLGTKLAGKVVVDIANPLNSTYDGLATAADSSSAEDVAKAASPGAQVLKAFNTTFARTLDAGQVGGQMLDVLIAGDDVESKNKLAQLIRDGGLRAIDVGPLSRARQLEGIGLLHITLQAQLGTKFMSAVKIIS